MTSLVSSQPQEPGPPSYAEARRTSCLPAGVTSIDFAPRCVDDGGILTSVKFERFDLLVARANSWLRAHPCIGVKCCETVEYRSSGCQYGTVVDTSCMLSLDQSHSPFTFLILRLWIFVKDDSTPYQLAYINVVPACLHPGGVISKPRFDLLHNVVNKLSAMVHRRPIPGKILNIETVHAKLRQYSEWLEPDRCHWQQFTDIGVDVLTLLRVFYIPGKVEPLNGTLRFKDFAPSRKNENKKTRWECQEEVMTSLNHWLKSNSFCSVINLETQQRPVKVHKEKFHLGESIHTLQNSCKSSSLLNVTRLWFVERDRVPDILPINEGVMIQGTAAQELLCEDFFPPLSNVSADTEHYESLKVTLEILEKWQLKNAGVCVKWVETCSSGVDSCMRRSDSLFSNAATFTSKEERHASLLYLRVYYCKNSDVSNPVPR